MEVVSKLSIKRSLTIGNVYEVEDTIGDNIIIIDDSGFRVGYNKAVFQIEEFFSDKEFCHNHTQFYGDVIDKVKQISLWSGNGEELKEYVEHHIKMYLEKRQS